MKILFRKQRGSSLVEIIVAVGVLAVGLYAIAEGLQMSRAGTARTITVLQADVAASNILELLQVKSDSVAEALKNQPAGLIPAEGWSEYASDPHLEWKAELKKKDNNIALVRVSVRSKRTNSKDVPVLERQGVIVLSAGGAR